MGEFKLLLYAFGGFFGLFAIALILEWALDFKSPVPTIFI